MLPVELVAVRVTVPVVVWLPPLVLEVFAPPPPQAEIPAPIMAKTINQLISRHAADLRLRRPPSHSKNMPGNPITPTNNLPTRSVEWLTAALLDETVMVAVEVCAAVLDELKVKLNGLKLQLTFESVDWQLSVTVPL